MRACFPTSRQERTRYEFSESVLPHRVRSAGSAGTDSPRAARAIRDRSFQLADVSSEDSKKNDPPADVEESSLDDSAAPADCVAGRSFCQTLHASERHSQWTAGRAGPRF